MLTALAERVVFWSEALLFSVSTFVLPDVTALVCVPFLVEPSRKPEFEVVLLAVVLTFDSFVPPTDVLLFLPEEFAETSLPLVLLPSFRITFVPVDLRLP